MVPGLEVGLADVALVCGIFALFVLSQVAVFAISDEIRDRRQRRRGGVA